MYYTAADCFATVALADWVVPASLLWSPRAEVMMKYIAAPLWLARLVVDPMASYC